MRFKIFAAAIACLGLGVSTSVAGAASAAYPTRGQVARSIQRLVNQQSRQEQYGWFETVSCKAAASAGDFTCSGTGANRRGRIVTRANWTVSSTTDGKWTATSVWVIQGQVGAP